MPVVPSTQSCSTRILSCRVHCSLLLSLAFPHHYDHLKSSLVTGLPRRGPHRRASSPPSRRAPGGGLRWTVERARGAGQERGLRYVCENGGGRGREVGARQGQRKARTTQLNTLAGRGERRKASPAEPPTPPNWPHTKRLWGRGCLQKE